jgi:hypothetical protein
MTTSKGPAQSATSVVSQRIGEIGGWRGATLERMRRLILEEEPTVVEELKWKGVPTWSRDGILCTGESYKDKVKLTFARGASLRDPSRLFNASLEGNARRAIDTGEGEQVDGAAFKALVREAIAANHSANAKRAKASPASRPPAAKKPNG